MKQENIKKIAQKEKLHRNATKKRKMYDKDNRSKIVLKKVYEKENYKENSHTKQKIAWK